MPIFSYQATDKKGQEVTGMVEADSLALAINQVRSLGYFPTKVKEDAGKLARRKRVVKGKGISVNLSFGGVKRKQITLLTRQLATLIDAGLPLLRSLSILHDQQKPGKLKNILDELVNDVQSGTTFSEALAKHPKAFDKLYVNMVRAGEVGGMLEVVLNRLAEFAERREALARKVKGAMIYPIMVILVAGGVVTFLLMRVVPTFAEIFSDLGGALPAPTQFLVNVSEALQQSFLKIVGTIVAIIVAIRMIFKIELVRAIRDRIVLKLPLFGMLVRKIGVARFSRTLGTLITSGVPILQSLSIVKETISNRVIANAVGEVHDSIREGETIAGPLEESGAFPPMAVNMIDVGEETGNLDSMLLKVADIYDAEVEVAIGGMLQMLEPAMMVVLGGIVGFIVISMYLPIFSMGDLI
ncbi:MAG: type II secretion system F family protein [Candidatus Abyssobacteria bacterium SURF_17]|uniref:General secretion pathway protein F n=1 Tax=Candidatus Abyssobacteria bacterium SURF_17 TaxID=2093361 RepID=A0A419EW79_9BACT|nr:MAG: type II secretion system F family protein [Candidatus Abyssubacteria bacterium SURF_17]